MIRRFFAVRYCRPGEYVLRLLAELVMLPASLAVLRWLLPLYRLPAFGSWPRAWRLAVAAFLGVLFVLDVALLRVRREVSR